MIITTILDYPYSKIDDRVFNHDGCIVDLGCSGWDWCNIFIGKKRIIGVDPYETPIDGVEFFEGLVGPVNGEIPVQNTGIGTSIINGKPNDNYLNFPMLTWKEFCKKFNITSISALKINIEGSEYSLLNSMDIEDYKNIDQIAVSFHDFQNENFKYLTENTIELLIKMGYEVQSIEKRFGWYLAIKKDVVNNTMTKKFNRDMHKNVTIVTGLFDLGRGEMSGWGKRDFNQYKERFFELLQTDVNLAIWIPKSLEEEVWSIRSPHNTAVYIKENEDFKTWFPFWEEVQKIRTDENWINSAGWLSESPQAALEFYNPMMMTKMFMLHDTVIFNPFNTDYFFWMDGGLTSTVSLGYFTLDKVLDKLDYYCSTIKKFLHITYPYTANDEIHGFERKKLDEYCGVDFVDYVARGGFFGGEKELIRSMNGLYYNILETTLRDGYMGADECLFTILCHRHPDLIHRFEIEGNGLVWPFFEHLKMLDTSKEVVNIKPFNSIKTSLYVLTYNSPNQFEQLCLSFYNADKNFLEKPSKFLINNSTDRTTDEDYRILCEKYQFEEIKKDNIGICGGRQFVAEHFDESDSDYYIFFEDDMNLCEKTTDLCNMGFPKYVDNLFNRSLKIIHEEQYDYLKLSFSEFFGDNSVQWAWYNIPQVVREEYFPNNKKLPLRGTDPNAPKTIFKTIKRSNDITYIEGNVHYDNWPLWFTKLGNKKVFIDVKWGRPYEQTWMSFVFQEQMKGNINSAVLLISPINHHRFEFYPGTERREN